MTNHALGPFPGCFVKPGTFHGVGDMSILIRFSFDSSLERQCVSLAIRTHLRISRSRAFPIGLIRTSIHGYIYVVMNVHIHQDISISVIT